MIIKKFKNERILNSIGQLESHPVLFVEMSKDELNRANKEIHRINQETINSWFNGPVLTHWKAGINTLRYNKDEMDDLGFFCKFFSVTVKRKPDKMFIEIV